MDNTNKIALVSGASRGIGRAITQRLAHDGYAVIAGYSGSKEQAATLVASIIRDGGNALAVQGDIAQEDGVRALFNAAHEAFGGVDIVVHSAGIMDMLPIAECSVEQFDKTIAINLRGTFLMLREAARTVREGGRIMALSSSVIPQAFPAYGPYACSKSGVETLVRVLANELRGKNICVNAIAPGPVATELFLTGKTDEQIERLAKMPPLERLGEPDDIANLAAFLAGPDGGWINGQVIRSNGGFV